MKKEEKNTQIDDYNSANLENTKQPAFKSENNKNNKYDMIFIDAAKAQYNSFFEPCFSMLRHGGLLVSDNVLYKGMTATDDLVLHRKRTIVKRLREYIKMLCEHESLETAVLPLGDGVALSIKR